LDVDWRVISLGEVGSESVLYRASQRASGLSVASDNF